MPYLTNAEYVTRFGAVETIRLTDELKSGAVDQGKLTEAIADQEQIIDSYLAGRYVLPLPGTHPILEGISAALTREALHRERPTVAVTEQADRARAQLRDLAAGRATIPVAPGETPPTESPGDIAVRAYDAPARVFTPCALDDFTSLGGYRGHTVFDGPRGW